MLGNALERTASAKTDGGIRDQHSRHGIYSENSLRQLDPLAVRRELLVRAPVRPRVLRLPHLLERHRQIEVRVGVERVEAQRLAVAGLRFAEASEVVVDVARG